jgi:hypothetical protein
MVAYRWQSLELGYAYKGIRDQVLWHISDKVTKVGV